MFWLLPGKGFGDGLRKVNCDAETNSMVALVPRIRTFVMYVDHHDMIKEILDDGAGPV